MLIIFALLFKLHPPEQLKDSSHKKLIKNDFYLRCGNYYLNMVDETYTKNALINCESGALTTVQDSTFIRVNVPVPRWPNDWGHFMLFKYSDITIQKCKFEDCTYQQEMIKMEDESDNTLRFYENSVVNCISSGDHNNIYTDYHNNYIENNYFKFDKDNKQDRFIYCCYSTGCHLIRNTVVNGNNNQGSFLKTEYNGKDDDELEVSHCTFTNCKGSESSIFHLSYVKSGTTFTNITVNYCKNDKNLASISPPDNEGTYVILLKDCKFSYVESTGKSGGIAWSILKGGKNNYKYNFDLRFEGTTFEHIRCNDGTYGGGAYGVTTDNTDGCRIQLTIKECHFKNTTCANGAGGAIYFNSYGQSLTIEKSDFTNTFRDNNNGGAINIKYTNGPMPVIIKDCSFDSTRSSNGGSIYIENFDQCADSNIDILNCNFKNSESTSNGNAIMISKSLTNFVSIKNCNFNNCGKNHISFAVKVNVEQLVFVQNKITFTDAMNSCGCLLLDSCVAHTIRGNIFQNAKYDEFESNNWVSAGIHCPNCNNNYLLIENNTFDNIVGNNQGRCMSILQISKQITFTNNTVQNCQDGGIFLKFGFKIKIDSFVIEKLRLLHNNIGDYWDAGAGSTPQIWVENSVSNNFDLIFSECYFEENKNLKKGGGGIKYGENSYNIDTKVSFLNCHFINNYAKEAGGAISIISNQGCEINDCVFIKNRSDNGSGAVFYKTDQLSSIIVNIKRCQFDECSGKETNAINVNKGTNSDINIFQCNFNKCGEDGFVIRMEASANNIFIKNCTIDFLKDAAKTAGGIYFATDDININGNTFKNFKNTVLRIYTKINEHNQIQLIENNFIECSISSVLDIETVVTSNPIIRGNKFDKISMNNPFITFKLKDSIGSLSFDNNEFSNFDVNTEFGGIGLDINHETTSIKYKMSFKDCRFINNNNNEPSHHGSSISFDSHQNSGNVELSISGCHFEKNRGNGPLIYANIVYGIDIKGCTFDQNNGEKEGSIFIVPDFEGSTESSTISIADCVFQKNEATKFSSIYIASGSTRTISISSCTFEEEKGCIYLDNIKNSIELVENNFHNTIEKTALTLIHPKGSNVNDQISIDSCTFDACNGPINKCFDISTHTKNFNFRYNVIQNNKATGYDNYIGLINNNNQLIKLEFINISFLNNECDSLYGGGVGLQFGGIDDLSFLSCKFINNSARQNTEKSRPTQNADQTYYNGDGGAIQLGYICTMNQFDITFERCEFKYNHAHRHGGAISIQTIKDVYVLDCIFEENSANYYFYSNSADLLVNNHFHKKHDGRGGAIYINPSFTYSDDSIGCNPPSVFNVDVKIQRCKFIKNTGFDAYAIYVEGEVLDTPITIIDNTFLNNYNESHYIGEDKLNMYGAVIATEICNMDDKEVSNQNTFINDNKEIKILNVSCVDHYGNTPSLEFSQSNDFSQSNKFTYSSAFSNSFAFQQTDKFSQSNHFSNSDVFSSSQQFSASDAFNPSDPFTNTLIKDHSVIETSSISETPELSDETSLSNSVSESIDETSLSDSISESIDETSLSNSVSESIDETSLSDSISESIDETSLSNSVSESIDETSLSNSVSESIDETSLSNSVSESIDETSLSDSISESIDETSLSNSISESIDEASLSNSVSESIDETSLSNSISETQESSDETSLSHSISETPEPNKDATSVTSSISETPEPNKDSTTANIVSETSKPNDEVIRSITINPTEKITDVNHNNTGIDSQTRSTKSNKLPLIIGIVVGLLVVIAIIIIVIIIVIRRKKNEVDSEKAEETIEMDFQNSFNADLERSEEYTNPLYNNPHFIENDPFQKSANEDSESI